MTRTEDRELAQWFKTAIEDYKTVNKLNDFRYYTNNACYDMQEED